jgi:hypothetical protein
MPDHLPADSEPLPGSKLGEIIFSFLGKIPESDQQLSTTPVASAAKVARSAATSAATTASALALPPGPLGWLTLIPEILAVWRIQAKMVADIAAIYGQETWLSREQMLYCLFRHAAAQAVRDIAVRVGNRVLIKTASQETLRGITKKIGVAIGKQALRKGAARWVPLAGAAAVGAYAFYDTTQVARTAIKLFESAATPPPFPPVERKA